MIAHRLDTIVHADHILVLRDGEIAQQGRHAQLLAEDGPYARLWQLGAYAGPMPKGELTC